MLSQIASTLSWVVRAIAPICPQRADPRSYEGLRPQTMKLYRESVGAFSNWMMLSGCAPHFAHELDECVLAYTKTVKLS